MMENGRNEARREYEDREEKQKTEGNPAKIQIGRSPVTPSHDGGS